MLEIIWGFDEPDYGPTMRACDVDRYHRYQVDQGGRQWGDSTLQGYLLKNIQ